jgi:hypothetical protein
MTTRFDARDGVNYGVQGVKSGYDGLKGDLTIPSCGIEDVDVAMFNLFEKEINLYVGGNEDVEARKVPVIFAAGEKWALLKKGKPIRDRNNSLILPLITIMRTKIEQNMKDDINGRGINQQTGEIVVRRRLDKSDRSYQNLINKIFINNQTNVAVNPEDPSVLTQVTTDREIGQLQDETFVKSGALLQGHRKNNIFETIVVPSPQFYTVKYEVVVWAQYTQHMNQLAEKLMSSFLPQGQCWKLTTPKRYWFIASVDGGIDSETNFDDMASGERFIKLKMNITVPAYVWLSAAPGVPIPIKRYVSTPIISFDVEPTKNLPEEGSPEEFQNNFTLGSDDPTLPLDDAENARDDQRRPGWRRGRVQPKNSAEEIDANDPALLSYPRGYAPYGYRKIVVGGETKYARILSTNPTTGETVYSAAELDRLRIIHP